MIEVRTVYTGLDFKRSGVLLTAIACAVAEVETVNQRPGIHLQVMPVVRVLCPSSPRGMPVSFIACCFTIEKGSNTTAIFVTSVSS